MDASEAGDYIAKHSRSAPGITLGAGPAKGAPR